MAGLSADECSRADGGLAFRHAPSVFSIALDVFRLFNGDVAKLRRIEYFAAVLTFDEFYVLFAGYDLYDGMFTGGGHGEGAVDSMDFARLTGCCQLSFGELGPRGIVA